MFGEVPSAHHVLQFSGGEAAWRRGGVLHRDGTFQGGAVWKQLSFFRCVQGGEISKVSAPAALPAVSLHYDRAAAVRASNCCHTKTPFLYCHCSGYHPIYQGGDKIKVCENSLPNPVIPGILETDICISKEAGETCSTLAWPSKASTVRLCPPTGRRFSGHWRIVWGWGAERAGSCGFRPDGPLAKQVVGLIPYAMQEADFVDW